MSEPQKDMSRFRVRQLKSMARHGDEDAKAELHRRMAESVTSYERSKDRAERDGAQ